MKGCVTGNTQANQVEALTELNGEDFALARTQTLLFANTQYVSVMDRLIALRGGAQRSEPRGAQHLRERRARAAAGAVRDGEGYAGRRRER